jgi:acyl-coenzyme A thioesterase PaaI-like protein
MNGQNEQPHYCFGCSKRNPLGLHLSFKTTGGEVTALFTPVAEHQGWPGFVHGGLVATMLDEAMGWATMSHGIWAVTGKINVRYRDPVPLFDPVTIVGMIEKNRGRWVTVRAEIRSKQGAVLSEADAIFMRVSGERQRELEEIYRGMTVEDVAGPP